MRMKMELTNSQIISTMILYCQKAAAGQLLLSAASLLMILSLSHQANAIGPPLPLPPPPPPPPIGGGGYSLQMNPYTRATNELLLDLRQQMLTKSIKFDEHFRTLLSSSKLGLHNMFADTYGMMYEHNTEVFTSMFESLEQYYANGQIKLTKSMENFFERLYQKIFQVYNNNKSFSPLYLECATEQLAQLKPFKDVPEKLIDGIKHAFVSARTFVQALNNGIDVIKNIISLGQPNQCIKLINDKLLKHTQPGFNNQQLAGQAPQLPCLNYCEQVISRCIGRGNLEQLNDRWRAYIWALNELVLKLITNYNIETIISPLAVQISEAIMNFQENAQNITMHVFQVCGRVPTSEHLGPLKQANNRLGKRAATPVVVHNRNPHHSISVLQQPTPSFTLNAHLRAAGPGASLLPIDLTLPMSHKPPVLIDEIKSYMLSTKSFWLTLPTAVCTSNYTLGPNATKKQINCFQEPLGLSDVNSDMRYRVEIHQQVNQLESMRSKIEMALKGVEIEWNSSTDQRVPPFNSILNPNYRLPSVTTTTTTTTTPEPILEETEEDDILPSEEGSGDDFRQDYSTPDMDDVLDDHDLDSTTESSDLDENTSEDQIKENSNDDSPSSSSETSTPPNTEDNTIDRPSPPVSDETLNFITPPNQPGAQKSSQTSSKLVISNDGQLLFALLLSVALLIVTNFQNNQLIVHKPDDR